MWKLSIFLLDKGLSVNLTDTNDFTPLHFSAEFGHLDATKALVERGAAINNTNKYGETLLMRAVFSGKLESLITSQKKALILISVITKTYLSSTVRLYLVIWKLSI